VKVPVGSEARVSVPRPAGATTFEIREGEVTVWRGGQLVAEMDGISAACEEGGYVTFSVGSGAYTFLATHG
jgi:hypothetical protein